MLATVLVTFGLRLLVGAPGWSAAAVITTVAGNGQPGYSGDGGPAATARLNEPRMMTVDGNGAMYIADTFNHVIRKVDPSGVISTFAGFYPGPTPATEENCPSGFGGDGGPARLASLRCPHSVIVGPDGAVIIADSGNQRIRRVDINGVITTVAGTGESGFSGDGGPATAARLKDPKGLALAHDGSVLIADSLNNRIRRVDGYGVITTIAGTGAETDSGDGGPATAASLTRPRTLAVTADGSILVAEPWANRIRRIDPQGIISTVAGSGAAGFAGDGGAAAQAMLHTPRGVGADEAGNVYIADSLNNRIRRVDTNGVITTIAGDGRRAFAGDGGPAASAPLAGPRAVTVTASGDLYVADTYNFRIRRIAGVVPPTVTPPPLEMPAPPVDNAPTVAQDPLVQNPPPSQPTPPPSPVSTESGYWMISADGHIYGFGTATNLGEPLGPARSDIEPTPSGRGYWVLAEDGGVFAYGDAESFGRPTVSGRYVSMSATPTGKGYWTFTDRGEVFAFGDAAFYGDLAAVRLNGPVVDSVATPSGRGYWMVASDGGMFAFGDATFHGSTGAMKLNRSVLSMAPDPDGAGYWLVASDGGIFAFDAPFYGSMGATRLNKPVSGMVTGPAGYLMVAEDGGVFAFGNVAFHGSLGARPPASPVVAVAMLP
ncbi:MAG TPA: NHL repeat-containing protein [Acidimicrobiia bacterium]|nr:NHL repeat-containing protein [Acidimicrobiia bacterium]